MPKPAESNKWVLKHERKNYIYFSPLTTGASGRPVKIHKDLFLPFFCAVNPATYDGQLIIRTIESLRTTPSHTSTTGKHAKRLQNIKDTFQHALEIKNIQLFYRIDQETDNDSPAVYISQIRVIHAGDTKEPGLYARATKLGTSNTEIKKVNNKSLDGRTVYINGLLTDLESSMNHAEYAANTKKDLSLFYMPARVCNDLGTWSAKTSSIISQRTIQELTDVLKHNQKANKGINWIVEGEGSAILEKALQNTPGTLKNHNFKLINPKADTPRLLQSISAKKANLTGQFFNYSTDETALISLASHKEALIKQIGQLPNAKNYDKITRNNIVSQIGALAQVASSVIKQSSGLQSKSNTFIDALKKAGVFRK